MKLFIVCFIIGVIGYFTNAEGDAETYKII